MLWKTSLQLLAQQYVPPRPFPSQKAISSTFHLPAVTASRRELREGIPVRQESLCSAFPLPLEELDLEAPSNIQELLDFPLSTSFLQKRVHKPRCNSQGIWDPLERKLMWSSLSLTMIISMIMLITLSGDLNLRGLETQN